MKKYILYSLLCLLFVIYLYKLKSTSYHLVKFEIEDISNDIKKYSKLLKESRENLDRIRKENMENIAINDMRINILKNNSYTKREILNLIYVKSIENDVNILKTSEAVMRSTYKKYSLYDISIELVASMDKILNYIVSLNYSSKKIDFSRFSLYCTSKSCIISIGYIGENNEQD